MNNTTMPLQPSEEAPLKGKPCTEGSSTIRDFSRQDLLNPRQFGYNNLLEHIQFFIKFQRKERSSLQLG